MSFLLYKTSGNATNITDYSLIREVKLAGKEGPFAKFVNEKNIDIKFPFEWEMSESDILTYMNLDNKTHAVIANIKPDSTKYVALCRFDKVWGYTNEWWTPLLVRLKTIHFDKEHENPNEFIKQFSDQDAKNEIVHEFLYLQGGIKHHNWGWGPSGMVNAALLWPDALEYFLGVLNDFMREYKSQGKI